MEDNNILAINNTYKLEMPFRIKPTNTKIKIVIDK